MKKRVVCFLIGLMMIALFFTPAYAEFEMTADDGVNWVLSLPEGKGYEADNVTYGEAKYACVDLIKGYIMHIRGTDSSDTSGDAKDYSSNELPDGFDRYSRSETSVQKGDIIIWTQDPYGHVGICTAVDSSGIIYSDQNGYDYVNQVSYAHKVKHGQRITASNNNYWGVIRPQFSKYSLQEKQIMANAQELLDQYANMNQYINWLANEQLYYRRTLNDADCYRNAYTYIMSYGTALVDVGLHVISGDALSSVVNAAKNTVENELNCYFPEMTTEQFIYSQARMGVDDVEREKLFDIQNALEDGKFVDPVNAAKFILIYQQNKAALAAAEMGKQYYYNELQKSFWDHLGSLFTSVATCQVADLFKATGADFDTGRLADELLNMLGIVSDCYDNEYVDAWMTKLVQINRETENLYAPELAGSGSGSGNVPLPTCTVTFDGNGGSIGLEQCSYTLDMAFGYLPTPFRFGYDFLGWYDSAGTRAVYTSSSVANGNISLYARWDRVILDSGSCGDHLTYALYGDGVLDIVGSGDMTSTPWSGYARRIGEVVLPEGLTSIASSAFYGCIYLHEINLPSTVKRIGDYAFSNTGLLSLTLPDGVEYLGKSILSGSSEVKELTVPGSVRSMNYYTSETGTLSGTSLEKVIFAEGLTEIGVNALKGVKTLTQVELPSTLKTIRKSAFSGCENLTAILLPVGLETIQEGAFAGTGLTELSLPSGIKYLGGGILSGNDKVKTLTIPNSLTSGSNVTGGSAVEKVIFEEGIQSIPSNVLEGGTALTEVVIPSTVKSIGDYAFSNTGLLSLTLPDGVEYLGKSILSGSSEVKELTVPGSVRSMNYYTSETGTLSGTSLEKVVFAEGLTVIGCNALKGVVTLTQVELPSTLKTIRERAFSGCENLTIYYHSSQESWNAITIDTGNDSLKNANIHFLSVLPVPDFVIPDALIDIGDEAFTGCRFTCVKLSENCVKIGSNAFAGCPNLKYIFIPNMRAEIEVNAFGNIAGLTIFGRVGSTAETFASERGFTFVAVP